MQKINFVNNQAPALNSTNLNLLQDNIETSINGVMGSNANGSYIKYDNGLLIQWGYAEAPANISYATITFPISFIDTNYELLANHKYRGWADYGGSAQLRCITTGQANSASGGYAYSVFSDGTTPTFKRQASFIAIGKWK